MLEEMKGAIHCSAFLVKELSEEVGKSLRNVFLVGFRVNTEVANRRPALRSLGIWPCH
jgi:hypothetical protein